MKNLRIALSCLMLWCVSNFPAMAMDAGSVPTKFPIPWAAAATCTTPYASNCYITFPIPTTSSVPCAATLTYGFPPLTTVPTVSGGCGPFNPDMNGILQQLSLWSQWQSAGAAVVYDATFSAAVGGYPSHAVLAQASTPGCVWISGIDNNLSDPDTGGANWFNPCALGGVLTGSPYNAGLAATGVSAGAYPAAGVVVGADGRLTVAAPIPATSTTVNFSLSAVSTADQLVVSVLDSYGDTPTNGSPVVMQFRSSTQGSGAVSLGFARSAMTFTATTGNSLGCVNAAICRLWVVAAYNGGSPALCLYRATSGTTVVGLNQGAVYAGASGTEGSAAQTLYCSSAVSNSPILYLGYIEVVWTSASNWSANPTAIQLMGPGIALPGSAVQGPLYALSPTAEASQTIVPTSAANLIRVTFNVQLGWTSGGSGGAFPTIVLKRGSTQIGYGVDMAVTGLDGQSLSQNAAQTIVDTPATTSSITYTWTNSGAVISTTSSSITVEEIQSSLEPANDNEKWSAAG